MTTSYSAWVILDGDEVFVISTISRIIKVEVKGLIMNHSHTVHDMITLDFECP